VRTTYTEEPAIQHQSLRALSALDISSYHNTCISLNWQRPALCFTPSTTSLREGRLAGVQSEH